MGDAAPGAVVVEVAGVVIAIRGSSAAVVEAMTAALAHLRVPDGRADDVDVTVDVWDASATGVVPPPAPCGPNDFTPRGDLLGFSSQRYRISFHGGEETVSAMDTGTGHAAVCLRSVDRLPWWVRAAPLRPVIQWAIAGHGAQLLHAAAVGTGSGAVLLVGPGGSGKSTTALAALDAGWSFLGDDYVALRLDPHPTVTPLYHVAKAYPRSIVDSPALLTLVSNAGELADGRNDKALMPLWPTFAAQMPPSLPVRAIVVAQLPAPGGQERDSRLVPIRSERVRSAAEFSTLVQLPGVNAALATFMTALLTRVPAFALRLGTDRDGVLRSLAELLELGVRERRDLAERLTDRAAPPTDETISVVVPVFNGAATIGAALASIVDQGDPNVEVIVVDDGSTDDLDAALADASAVRALGDRLRVIRQPNAGPAAARNRGIGAARGDLIGFVDADDEWAPGGLAVLRHALADDPTLFVVAGHAQLTWPDPATARQVDQAGPADSFPYSIGARLFRRHVFQRIGLFDESLRVGEDTDWMLRLLESGLATRRVEATTLIVRRNGQSATAALSTAQHRQALLRSLQRRVGRNRTG